MAIKVKTVNLNPSTMELLTEIQDTIGLDDTGTKTAKHRIVHAGLVLLGRKLAGAQRKQGDKS